MARIVNGLLLTIASALAACSAANVGPRASAPARCGATWVEVARVVGFVDYGRAEEDARVRSARRALADAGVASEGMMGGVAWEEDGTCSDLFVTRARVCGWYAVTVVSEDVAVARAALVRAGVTPVPDEDAMTSEPSAGALAACRRLPIGP